MAVSKLNFSLLALSTAVLLSACTTTPVPEKTVTSKKPVTTLPAAKATKQELYGDRRDDLDAVARLYKANPKDEFTAGRYAKALRESGDLKQAERILSPFVKDKSPATLTYTEMGAMELETGDFKNAESYAKKAIKADGGNYRAWHVLGIAQDAQQNHVEAETAFRKALTLWQGDSVPVMNNLALNLAAQGYTDKALDMLYAAKSKDPGRVEIERNIRIIRTLNEPSEYNLDVPGATAASKKP